MGSNVAVGIARAVVATAIAVVCASGSGSQELDSRAEALRGVVLRDGVSKSEATLIASYFFYEHARVGCGGSGEATDAGADWFVPTAIGISGAPGDPIRIDKRAGAVRFHGRVCVENPLAMLEGLPLAAFCDVSPAVGFQVWLQPLPPNRIEPPEVQGRKARVAGPP